MISKELLDKLSKHKDPEVRELAEEHQKLTSSPVIDGYRALRVQIDFWNHELIKSPVSISSGTEEDQRVFDKAHKYATSIDALYLKLDTMRNRINPDALKGAEQQATSDVDTIREKFKSENRTG